MATVLRWPAAGHSADPLTDGVQQQLARWNRERLAPALPASDWRLALERDQDMLALEAWFLEYFRAEVSEEARQAPPDSWAFLDGHEVPVIEKPFGPGAFEHAVHRILTGCGNV